MLIKRQKCNTTRFRNYYSWIFSFSSWCQRLKNRWNDRKGVLEVSCSSQNDAPTAEDLIAARAPLFEEKVILTTKTDHASSDRSDNKQKSDVKDSGEGFSVFESKHVVEIPKGDSSWVSVMEEEVILPALFPPFAVLFVLLRSAAQSILRVVCQSRFAFVPLSCLAFSPRYFDLTLICRKFY